MNVLQNPRAVVVLAIFTIVLSIFCLQHAGAQEVAKCEKDCKQQSQPVKHKVATSSTWHLYW